LHRLFEDCEVEECPLGVTSVACLKTAKVARWTAGVAASLPAAAAGAGEGLGELGASGRVLPAAPGLSVLALLGLALLLIGITRLRR
jgi:hypothetical protein